MGGDQAGYFVGPAFFHCCMEYPQAPRIRALSILECFFGTLKAKPQTYPVLAKAIEKGAACSQ